MPVRVAGGGGTSAAAGLAGAAGGPEGAEGEREDAVEAAGRASRKTTVLETHGYLVGGTIGSGSYATVKVTPVRSSRAAGVGARAGGNHTHFPSEQVARSERHDCDVAVKIVSKIQAPIDYLRKFLPREIEVVKGLRHPNLIRFLQAIETTHR